MSHRFQFDEHTSRHGVASLVELLEERGTRQPDALFMAFHHGHNVSFGQLRDGALRCAAQLLALGLERGDRVVLLYPTSPALLYALFGAKYAGGVPVPMYPPPALRGLEGYLERQLRLVENARPRFLLCDHRLLRVAMRIQRRFGLELHIAGCTEMEQRTPMDGPPRLPAASDTALIQYTSGSTGRPKGVVLTHGAVLSNCQALGEPVGFTPDDWMINWLPLYHDMGLIGMVMFPLCYGVRTTMMSPRDFLQDPMSWLRAISRGRGTIAVAPNFAYGYLLRRVRNSALPPDLDLSRWRICYHGAEPISAEIMDDFTARFEPFGFRRETFSPVYGLAENALIVTCPDHGSAPVVDAIDRRTFDEEHRAAPARPDDASPKRVVGVGRPVHGTELRVVDERGRPLSERCEGEILIRGSSMLSCYFDSPEATASTMRGGWFHTGDLGYLHAGELFITGRSKDLIVHKGSKHHPQDLEEVAGEVTGVRSGCTVAFGIHDVDRADALVVMVVESREEDPGRQRAIATEVTHRVAERVACRPDIVTVVPPKTVPKTSSGKLMRAVTRTHFLARVLGVAPDAVPSEDQLHLDKLRARLGLRPRRPR